jgi:hypothetical protein
MIMYYSYHYSAMKPKRERFRSTYVASTSQTYYDEWKKYLEGPDSDPWQKLTEQFAESMQSNLLLALTMVGIYPSDWNDIFRALINESSPFQGFGRLYWNRQMDDYWFTDKIVKETSKTIHYPAVYPEWFVLYGSKAVDPLQPIYLVLLAEYWDNIHDDYYKLWPTTRIGQDSPESARLRQLGETARREIDAVAKYGAERGKS